MQHAIVPELLKCRRDAEEVGQPLTRFVITGAQADELGEAFAWLTTSPFGKPMMPDEIVASLKAGRCMLFALPVEVRD